MATFITTKAITAITDMTLWSSDGTIRPFLIKGRNSFQHILIVIFLTHSPCGIYFSSSLGYIEPIRQVWVQSSIKPPDYI